MGSCISTCRPKKDFTQESCNCVQDKLVITQQAPTRTPKVAPIPVSNKISPCPSSPTTSTSSNSSLTGATSNNTSSIGISSCSSLSTSSSVLSSKDRSFSNEFLWSCLKENPHIVRINSIRESTLSSSMKIDSQKLNALAKSLAKQSIPEKGSLSIPQKRVRASSPSTLTRQKSFRKDSASSSLPSRTLRSPSPSRRFSGQGLIGDSGRGFATITQKTNCSARTTGLKLGGMTNNSVSSTLKKESLRPPSPIRNSNPLGTPLSNRETCIHRISSKIDEVAVGEALSHLDKDSDPIEDIDNPLISLDCFIFM
ncbi:hypothetical protein HS088_TW15G00981 [Tripterygium wilfordii]|uniref:Uncharacterized protein n=1 Tax=Tripterygium wilfordii TaxID=458696 RepID=A0A7J7CN28_TRIWF|nr:uncharacterized serine-rich protein C215.13-like [Tripterygium wilfordii]KAF5735474.1 hypothetical protein HS088_TW15G00981 [Tripterygium wilfordii]